MKQKDVELHDYIKTKRNINTNKKTDSVMKSGHKGINSLNNYTTADVNKQKEMSIRSTKTLITGK